MKTYIFLKNLADLHDNVIFIPVNNENFFGFLPHEYCTDKYTIPSIFIAVNKVKTILINFISVFGMFFISGYIFLKLICRGVIMSPPKKQAFKFGYDLLHVGLKEDRGLDNDGNFFIYDKGEFQPGAILHVIRGHLEDDKARESLESRGAPYIEFDKLKIPIDFFVRKIGYKLFISLPVVFFRSILSKNYSYVPLVPVMAAIKMNMEAEIFYDYADVKVFISRDDYSPFHIIRTIVANSRGNHTVGFQWADHFTRGIPLNILYFDKFLLYSDFYIEYNSKALKYSKSATIGCGIYWSDRMHQLITTDLIQPTYAKLKEKKYVLVGVLGSSFSEDSDVSKEQTLTFYRDSLEILKKYDFVYSIIKPKGDELNNELEALIDGNDRACIENHLWTPKFLFEMDLIICINNTTVGIESLYIGKKILFYDVINTQRDLYSKYSPMLVAKSREQLEENIYQVLEKHNYLDETLRQHIIKTHCGDFDGKVLQRLKKHCIDLATSDSP
jgi:hypothetical protein